MDPMQEEMFDINQLMKYKLPDSSRTFLETSSSLQNFVVHDPGEATSLSRKAFNADLDARQNVSFLFYVSNNMSNDGLSNIWCENFNTPCVTMSQIFTRLDDLMKIFINKDSISNSSGAVFNVHVSIVLLNDTNANVFCTSDFVLVTPQSPKFNYLFEFYSYRYYSNVVILQKLQCVTPLMSVRSDITRIYFHELELTLRVYSKPGLSFETYNCYILNSLFSIGYNTDFADTANENVTKAKDVIFEYVFSQEQLASSFYFGNFENAHFGNVTLTNVVSSSFRNINHLKMMDCMIPKGSYYFFNSITLQFLNLRAKTMAIKMSKVDSCEIANSMFALSGYYLPIILAEFGRELVVLNVVVWKVDQFMAVNAYETVLFKELNIFNCSVDLNAPRLQRSVIDVIATSTVTIEDSQFSYNYGQFGGAFFFETLATLRINSSTFIGCRSSHSGGSIFI
ncbi:hypothetical protein FDP41_011632 [Naegleria fowleri]|uniref:Uncharacterized protein n=1 Tax=Naegleria fowleri TaxID=5763 RepID=A0A6A5C766_NAEFO|nr:uncharacterized protein FDP41_011632 [Naegleria fowleri]KAF0982702.1 hypothetical protein FDP41_011632 [Naegleria fowleri]